MNRWLMASLVLTVLSAAACAWLWFGQRDLLQDPLPVHWNIENQPDQFVPLANAGPYLFISPAVMVLMLGLTLLLPWLSPKGFDIERFRDTYNYLMFLVIALFAYLNAAILLNHLKNPPIKLGIGELMVGGMFLFFALMGNVLGKVKRNFFMGVRTPWTLASETVWTQTHRWAAWLYTTAGVVGLVIVVLAGVAQAVFQFSAPWLFIPLFVGFMIVVMAPVPYSLILYKRLEKEGKLEPAAGGGAPAAT
jgi:uncharacterized membrane protein